MLPLARLAEVLQHLHFLFIALGFRKNMVYFNKSVMTVVLHLIKHSLLLGFSTEWTCPHIKKSSGLKSGERGGQAMGLPSIWMVFTRKLVTHLP